MLVTAGSCRHFKKAMVIHSSTYRYLRHMILCRRLLRVSAGKVQMVHLHHRVRLSQPERTPSAKIIKHECVTHSYIRQCRTLADSIHDKNAGKTVFKSHIRRRPIQYQSMDTMVPESDGYADNYTHKNPCTRCTALVCRRRPGQ